MFENLIESKPKKEQSTGQLVLSVILHVLLIFGAVKATQGAAETVKKLLSDSTAVFIKPPDPPPPPPPDQPPPDVVVAQNPPPQGFQTIVPPKEIPTEIPPVDLNQKFNAKDFSGKGVEGGIARGVVGGTGPVDIVSGESFTVDQVDDPVQYLDGPLPAYPPVLKTAGVEGKVSLRFIVGTDGRVESGTIQVLSSTNKAFEAPAIEAIKKSRFKPAKIRGAPVRQLVDQAVRFSLQG
ncbi:MAG: energy transducer TonB [Gemmatimonadota bacterium]